MNNLDTYVSYKKNQNYQSGYCYGYLVGNIKSIIKFINNFNKLSPEKASDILDIPIDYYNEIIYICNKYPTYSLKHQAKKVIYESSYMPYY